MPTGFGAGITVVTKSLPDAIVGVAYDTYTLDALDYTPPISWAIVAGALPAGMAMNPAGEVSGTPSAVGTFSVTVEATDGVAATKQQVLTLRVAPNLGNIRRHQMEDVLENGTSVVPIEGSGGLADLRRKLERLLNRLTGSQIVERYMLDAADLQVRNFNAVPVQSIEDALLALFGMISGFASGLDANGAGAPYVSAGANDEFNIVGLGSIQVAKNIGLNQLEISFTGAPLSAPFTMLPAPSGDITGAADTAALVALLAGATQDWLVSPQDETDNPYYINADLGSFLGTRKYRLTGKNRNALRIVGVGGQRTWYEVTNIENAVLTDVRIGGSNSALVANYDNCEISLSVAGALVDANAAYARIRRSRIALSHLNAMLFDGSADAVQLELLDSIVSHSVVDPATVLILTGAGASPAYLMLIGNHFNLASGTGLDLTTVHADSVLVLGVNNWNGAGTAIERATTPVTLAGRYVEAPQAVGVMTFEPVL